MEIVTGSTGEAHVTPIDDAVRNSNYGYANDRCVFTYYENLEARKLTENEVRVYSGYGMNQGRLFKIDRNDYDAVTIESGAQNMKRADLIVARYTMDGQTGYEDISLAVIKGQSGAEYVDPSYTTGDINSGDDLDDFPLYRVKINGLIIEEIEPLFNLMPDGGRLGFIEAKIDAHLENTTNPHTIAWTEASTLAPMNVSETLKIQFGKIAKAITSLITHIGNKNNPHEVSGSQLISPVPIEKGGTGASTAAQALVNLGVPSNVADSMAKTVYCDTNDYLKVGKGGIGDRVVDPTDGGVSGSRDVTTAGALYNTKAALQSAFQAGVDAVFNACANAGVTPSASTPTAVAAAIGALRSTPYTGTYRPTARVANNDMGIPHANRYVDTTAVPNTNSGTYTYPANSTGGTVDMGATNTNRYVNATNVYNKGKADAQAVSWTHIIDLATSSGTSPATLECSCSDINQLTLSAKARLANNTDSKIQFLSDNGIVKTYYLKDISVGGAIAIPSNATGLSVSIHPSGSTGCYITLTATYLAKKIR